MDTEPTTGPFEFFVIGKDNGGSFTLWDVCQAPADPTNRAIVLEEAEVDVHDAFGKLIASWADSAQDAVHQALCTLRERAGLNHYPLSGSSTLAPLTDSARCPAGRTELYGRASVQAATKDAGFHVKASTLPGLPSFHVRGLPDRCTAETRDRVRAGVINSNRHWPLSNILAEVAPLEDSAEQVTVAGSSALDLSIACTVLSAAGQLPESCLAGVVLVGELGLDGAVRIPRDLSSAVRAAAERGAEAIVVPADAVDNVAVAGVRVVGVGSLNDALETLAGHRHHPADCAHCGVGALPHRPCSPSGRCSAGGKNAHRR
ncbi:magnesium chelatase domain-containing protein [Streptomyces anulatus]|uniref:magnesium chelatase domain-containing protein n=1 Tax=Streptomyces anulatus TaxID=1892 RepID=UPI001D187952|nr:magnesium chelatase domain-containing protein [Streptomyces anulatus]